MMLRHALDGLTVIDFTQVAAGPVCTMLLADMGARVIKVESPEGDLGRKLGPAWIGDDSALYHAFNRNKEGIALDLKTEGGRAVARRLVDGADIVVESMRPGAMARLGLGADSVLEACPHLIYCSISAYGQTGPYAARAGVDGIVQADSGLMSLLGTPGTPPGKVQTPAVDVMTGYVACLGVLAKLHQLRRTGRGGHLDVNLMNAALALQQPSLASYLADGRLPDRLGSAAPYSAPNEALEASDGWLMVAAYHGNRWQTLCEVLGVSHLAEDPRFASSSCRVAHRGDMVKLLTEVTRTRPVSYWLERLQAADILCAPVATYADVERHPQVAANGMLPEISHPRLGAIRGPGFPIDSRESNAQAHRPAPSYGEHTRSVLEELGWDDAGVMHLVKEGAVACSAA
jgi:crotonobetainyl-CoA:carnitine CoA-transferase CaiB-like acyl-CoA transferase